MLLGRYIAFLDGLALVDGWKEIFRVIGRRIVAALLIGPHVAVKDNRLPGCPQADLSVSALHLDGRPLETRGFHLARHRAFPDEVIKFPLAGLACFQAPGTKRQVCGANAFMRLLRVLCLVFVDARGFGNVVIAV